MTFQSVGLCPLANLGDIVLRLNTSTPAIVRVLQTNESCSDHVVVFGPDHAAELFDSQNSTLAGDRLSNQAR